MTLRFSKLGQTLGVAAEGADLETLDGATTVSLRHALLENLVLCIRGQSIGPRAYREAMTAFGTPSVRRQQNQHPDISEINILSSEDRDVLGDGKRLVVGAAWHSDDSFKAVPCSLTMLYGIEIPPTGGDTQFTNMYAAYDGLSPELKQRIAPLRVLHRWNSSRKKNAVATLSAAETQALPDVDHPLVRVHPETGRKALYLNPNRMETILGMDPAESDALLEELTTHATRPEYQYRHVWRRGDIVIWDNRCTMHKANADYPEGSRRIMHRIVVEGTAPVGLH